MYSTSIQGSILVWYLIVAFIKEKRNFVNELSPEILAQIYSNLALTEVAYGLSRFFNIHKEEVDIFNLVNLIAFFIFQDIYFYTVHMYLHNYSIHYMHHTQFRPSCAWYADYREHLLLNVGSVGVSYILFPNNIVIFHLIIYLQIYTSVNGHTRGSKHHKHHLNPNKRYGSIYFIDYITNTD